MIADSSSLSTKQRTRQPEAPADRITFAFLTANIHIGAGRTVWPGVVDAAEKHGVNLICFPGGELRVPAGLEAQRNVIYDLIDARRLDGLVTWASTLGGTLEPSEITDFHRRFEPLPMVSLAQMMEKVPTLSIDSYEGMRAAVTHLIEVHGYRRLAFIRGPASHVYAQERYRAYTDVLQEYNLPLRTELVTRPVQWEAGAEAMQMLLDEAQLRPGIDFQAVVAVSDLLALGAMRTLQARGFQVPGDVAVVGFNDSIEGRLVTPPLTSVALPFYEQGARAVEMLCAELAGEELPAQVILQSRLVVRQSCGCPSQSVAQAATGPIQTRDEAFDEAFADIREAFFTAVEQIGLNADELNQWAGRLLKAFRSDLNGDSPGVFLHTLADVLDRVVTSGGEIVNWQKTISALRRCVLPYLDHRQRPRSEDLFGQARVVISEAAQRAQAYRQLQTERQAQALRDIGQALITTFDVDKLADVLAERLPGLGIVGCYLAL